MANADCVVIQGSNMAECHPVAYQWVTEAKLRGATVIHVDPRFTRTSAVADKHVPIRAGSDIVFLGALINHVLSNELHFDEYVRAYTNASTLISQDFLDTEDLDGIFSGYDPAQGTYDNSSWEYATADGTDPDVDHVEPWSPQVNVDPDTGTIGDPSALDDAEKTATASGDRLGASGPPLDHADALKDPTLQHPRCVFQILKRHFARYTPEMVERVCGISVDDFAFVADAVTRNSGRDRTTCFAYAVGWTQHTLGAQFIRTAAILQLLLGNMGRPGGGIMALRGHASIQGSTDIPTLFNLLPGYLPMPAAGKHDTFNDYVSAIFSPQQKGFWTGAKAYTVNLLKAWWGDAATADNDWAYGYLPRLTGNHNTYNTVVSMIKGEVEGYFVLGQNPAVGSSHGRMQREGLASLKWLVVRDLALIETATFWKDGPEVAAGTTRPEDIGTEVFFLPAASHAEKDGTFTQTQRLVQWHHAAVQPPGECRSDLHFFHELGKKLRERVRADHREAGIELEHLHAACDHHGDASPTPDSLVLKDGWDARRDLPLLDLTWDYPEDEHGEPSAEAILGEINGYHLEGEHAGQHLSSFTQMRDDGSTSGGCWIYTGVFAGGINRAANKVPGEQQTPVAPEWAWAWPANRRMLYNRASADPAGQPWSERKKYVWWDDDAQQWVGHDVPDFPLTKAPTFRSAPGTGGPEGLDGDDPFIMQPDGKGWLFAPKGMVDGPMPTHYEAQESPVRSPLYMQQRNPSRLLMPRPDNLSAPSAGHPGVEVYPYVFTTYRLTEHHTAGGMSRWLPYLSELQPEFFCEVSPELAAERKLVHGDYATIISPRAVIEARVMVTQRMTPLQIDGRTLHQIGLPYHWGVGEQAVVTGDSANDLLGVTLDPNVSIQESKVASCAILPGRRPQGAARDALVREYQRRAQLTTETGNDHLTSPEEEDSIPVSSPPPLPKDPS